MRKINLLKPGDKVQSHYRRRWTGIVIVSRPVDNSKRTFPDYKHYNEFGKELDKFWFHPEHVRVFCNIRPGCCIVKVTHDGKGRPQRKVFFKVLYYTWLRKR